MKIENEITAKDKQGRLWKIGKIDVKDEISADCSWNVSLYLISDEEVGRVDINFYPISESLKDALLDNDFMLIDDGVTSDFDQERHAIKNDVLDAIKKEIPDAIMVNNRWN